MGAKLSPAVNLQEEATVGIVQGRCGLALDTFLRGNVSSCARSQGWDFVATDPPEADFKKWRGKVARRCCDLDFREMRYSLERVRSEVASC